MAGLFAVTLATAVLLYRPFEARPFEFLDFPEFFGILERGRTLADRARGLFAYYQGQGRANVLAYALIAARWTVFGKHVVAWQVTRFVVMCALIAATFMLLRRLGASRTGALAGASLYVTTEAAAQGWLRLSMMEPLATLLLYSAALVACRFQRATRWRRDLVLICILVAAGVLTKEVIVAEIPLVVIIGLSMSPDGVLSRPARSRRSVLLVGSLAATTSAALLPTALAVVGAQPTAYAAAYGSVPIQPSRIVSFMLATLLPFDAFDSSGAAALATISFLLVIITGLLAGLRHPSGRPIARGALLIAGVVALGGAAVYLPWPNFQLFYTIPYLFAPALLLATSTTIVERYHSRARWAPYAGVMVVALYSAALAYGQTRRTVAEQRLVDRASVGIAAVPGVDTAVFAVAALNPRTWEGTGPTVARYATAVRHLAFPPVIDATCDSATRRIESSSRSTILVVLSSQCPPPARADAAMQESYQRWDWRRLRRVTDSLRADVVRGRLTGHDPT